MGKTAKLKSSTQSKSVHSRAARRAASPSLNVDKSITSLPRPEAYTTRSAAGVLGAQHNAGVSKKRKAKQMTRAQRLRQEKGLEKAEIVMDRTEKKVAKSVSKEKNAKARKAAWEDLNGEKRVVKAQNIEPMDTAEQEASPMPPAPVKSNGFAAMPTVDQQPEIDEEDEIT